MQRYSRKRQSIMDCLASTKEHPTAEWIYSKIKAEYPSLSLATVYRNLNMLKSEGLICSVGTVFGQERFDATVAPHTHAVCERCGRVVDVEEVMLPDDTAEKVEKACGFSVRRTDLSVYGICEECKAQKSQNTAEA